MAGNSADTGRSVTSKVIAILMTFGNGGTYSLTEIARLAGLPISTAHRLCNELVTWGMLERTCDGHFRVGLQLRCIASHAASVPTTFHERARRTMEDLAAAAGRGVVRLGVLENLAVAFIRKGPGYGPASTEFDTDTVPLHATAMGRALLAFSPPRLVDAVVDHGLTQYTPQTCTSPDRLRHALSVIRLTRVAVCRREYDPQLSSVAVPVFGAGGAVVAALEMVVRDSQDLRLVQPPLIVAGRSLTRELQSASSRPALSVAPAWHFDLAMSGTATWR